MSNDSYDCYISKTVVNVQLSQAWDMHNGSSLLSEMDESIKTLIPLDYSGVLYYIIKRGIGN